MKTQSPKPEPEKGRYRTGSALSPCYIPVILLPRGPGSGEGSQLIERKDDIVPLFVAALLDFGVLVGVLPGIGVELDVRQVGATLVRACHEILFHLLPFVLGCECESHKLCVL